MVIAPAFVENGVTVHDNPEASIRILVSIETVTVAQANVE